MIKPKHDFQYVLPITYRVLMKKYIVQLNWGPRESNPTRPNATWLDLTQLNLTPNHGFNVSRTYTMSPSSSFRSQLGLMITYDRLLRFSLTSSWSTAGRLRLSIRDRTRFTISARSIRLSWLSRASSCMFIENCERKNVSVYWIVFVKKSKKTKTPTNKRQNNCQTRSRSDTRGRQRDNFRLGKMITYSSLPSSQYVAA